MRNKTMKEMPILKDRQKKSKIAIICLILLFNIIMITNVGCTNKKEPIERMPANRRIMQLVYDPGGALTNEEFEERHQTYNVYGDGTIEIRLDVHVEDYVASDINLSECVDG